MEPEVLNIGYWDPLGVTAFGIGRVCHRVLTRSTQQHKPSVPFLDLVRRAPLALRLWRLPNENYMNGISSGS